ncbi:zinc finger and SCAN domain-containing protein 5B-like [Eptesicus fuscus]|uniref:zinc finger and SCAN domain-containing protein 5B-like n=1 Tax=Eptesicus fuscus TaxID=29078 RepID=UPI0024046069|nr:zinc finger and SCAN domain-containing protein 5B-like [Eptesicus fuscus]
MPTFQMCSDGPGNPQGILGWGLPPSRPPPGRLPEGQYRDSEMGHVLFRAFHPPEGSDPLQSLHTMDALLHRWLRPDVRTMRQILDQLVLEKFLTCMPLELQVLVKERRVQSCDELEVLLLNKEKPRRWTVVTLHGQEYLQENSDEEAGDTDLGVDLSVKSPSPISKAGAHPENSPEVLGEPGNQPGPSDVVWGQGQRVLLPETMLKTSDPQGVGPVVKVEEVEKDVMEDGEEAVLTSPEAPLPSSPESRRQIPYECQDCSKRFSYKSQLDLHRRTHTGERPFQCRYCPKRFIQASDLHVHHRIHTGRKPYCCTVCQERFTHASTLRGHERVHTQERPFQCDVCLKSFSHRGNLNVHMRTHTGLKPYRCPQCDGAFRQLGTFQRHRRTCQGAPLGLRVPADPGGKEGVPSGAEVVYEPLDSGGAMN